jgi:fumarylacetoacetase
VPVTAFPDHVFGVCLVNDWSARDLQAWEYVPLGPFLGKSFLTSVSPWVVPLAALEAARVTPPPRETAVLPYLDDAAHPWGLDITLEVRLNGAPVSCPPFRQMYWTAAQQLAHLTVNGAAVRTGDLFASGRLADRAVVERCRTADPARRLDPLVPRGRRRRHDLRVGARSGRHPDRLRRGHRPGAAGPLTTTGHGR